MHPFIWLVTELHSGIYDMNTDRNWYSNLLKGMEYAESSGMDYCLYHYNGSGLFPVFPKTIKEQFNK